MSKLIAQSQRIGMHMFGKKRNDGRRSAQTAESIGGTLQQFAEEYQRLVERQAAKAPATFPDGSPFDARFHLQNLANVATHIYSLGWPDGATLGYRLALLMFQIGAAAEEGPNLDSLASTAEARTTFEQRGKTAEVAVMVAASNYLLEYWNQSGAFQEWSDEFDRQAEAE